MPNSADADEPPDDPPLFVTRPYLPPLASFLPLLERIWESKTLTNGGPMHDGLERTLCARLAIDHLALCANGTLALTIAFRALELSGEVITSPYSFVATSHALLWGGLEPVFVDIDPATFNMDPARIEAAITPRTSAILPVHCYGTPCDVGAIQAIADKHDLRVIYDASHAFGVVDGSGSILRHGDLSTLSFHATKVFTTFEGGAIVCPDAKTRDHVNRLKNFGIVDETTVAVSGINGKMSEIAAAFGLLQLEYIDRLIARRGEIDRSYRRLLGHVPGIRFLERREDVSANYAYFPILVQDDYPVTRDGLYEALRRANIHARRYFYPLISDLPMYRDKPSAAPDNLPAARALAEQVLCLPIYPDMTDEDIARVASVVAR